MAILNIKGARKFVGELLGRPSPISPRMWQGMVDQGLPVGLIAGCRYISTETLQAWLESRVGLPLASSPMAPQATRRVVAPTHRRPRGRPKKTTK